MTDFKKIEAGKCKECGKPVYIRAGLVLGIPIYHRFGDDKICIECFAKNPEKYLACYSSKEKCPKGYIIADGTCNEKGCLERSQKK